MGPRNIHEFGTVRTFTVGKYLTRLNHPDDDCQAGSRYTVKSCSDFIFTALYKISSNIAAAAAMT